MMTKFQFWIAWYKPVANISIFCLIIIIFLLGCTTYGTANTLQLNFDATLDEFACLRP